MNDTHILFRLRRFRPIALAALYAAILVHSVAMAASPSDCTRLATLHLPAALVLDAELIPAGRFKADGLEGQPRLGSFCRVVGSGRPSRDSDIRFEVWVPEANWNGRLWGVGNGNFVGDVFTFNKTPQVLTINRADPNPTNADTVTFVVTFNKGVTGVTASVGGGKLVLTSSTTGATSSVAITNYVETDADNDTTDGPLGLSAGTSTAGADAVAAGCL